MRERSLSRTKTPKAPSGREISIRHFRPLVLEAPTGGGSLTERFPSERSFRGVARRGGRRIATRPWRLRVFGGAAGSHAAFHRPSRTPFRLRGLRETWRSKNRVPPPSAERPQGLPREPPIPMALCVLPLLGVFEGKLRGKTSSGQGTRGRGSASRAFPYPAANGYASDVEGGPPCPPSALSSPPLGTLAMGTSRGGFPAHTPQISTSRASGRFSFRALSFSTNQSSRVRSLCPGQAPVVWFLRRSYPPAPAENEESGVRRAFPISGKTLVLEGEGEEISELARRLAQGVAQVLERRKFWA